MNYSKKTIISFVLATFIMASSGIAQKFGHINSQQLLVESPLVKSADKDLEAFQKGLINAGQEMVKKFEAEYTKYAADAQAGGLSKIKMQQVEAELTNKQEAIRKYEVEVQQKIALKREELYKPILDKVQLVLDQIGKEGKYTMIFDTSTNGLLFAVDSENLIAKVKAKLGW